MSMKSNSPSERLAVCSWSLQPASPADLSAKLESTGIRRVQLALDPLRESPGTWGQAAALFRQKGITLVSGMFGCVGEDYSTLETIRRRAALRPTRRGSRTGPISGPQPRWRSSSG